MLEDGRRRLGHLHLVRDNERLKPAVPAQFVEAPALGQAEPLVMIPILTCSSGPAGSPPPSSGTLRAMICCRKVSFIAGRHVDLLGKERKTGLLQVGGVNL
jgi:hypothetical protein